MNIRLVRFPVAGGGGREVLVNPEQVVCVLDVGGDRSQIVTTGLSGEHSMSLIVERPMEAVFRGLMGPGREAIRSRSQHAMAGSPSPGAMIAL